MPEWPHFGKELRIRLTTCSLVLCLFVILVVSYFGFEGGTLILIAPVPDHCLHYTFLRNLPNDHSCILEKHYYVQLHKNKHLGYTDLEIG